MEVKPETLHEVEQAFRRYEAAVKAAGYAPNTERTYIDRAWLFFRWLKDDFTPGQGQSGR